jgi:hypothetical protein
MDFERECRREGGAFRAAKKLRRWCPPRRHPQRSALASHLKYHLDITIT